MYTSTNSIWENLNFKSKNLSHKIVQVESNQGMEIRTLETVLAQ